MLSLELLDTVPNVDTTILKLAECWKNWRGERLIPLRQDVRPEALGSALSGICIYEVIAPDEVIIRLESGVIRSLTSESAKGANVIAMTPEEDRAIRIERYQNTLFTPCGMLGRGDLKFAKGKVVDMLSIFLPVAEEVDGPARFVYVGQQVISTNDWKEDEMSVVSDLAHEFHYVDIGAGYPSANSACA
ncbi:PAS domain-containing protein [Sneathiella limimaris]|uniref:PAS domain-containing protein n=1 Tax=Sneathiella limimaris TaxID=1964213 RepID=UPI001469FD7F|nr:PAS domain-containing protein [Sneathiella limimaris]